MIRKLKALGLVLGAMLALGALLAGPASAQFHSEAAETQWTHSASQTQTFSYTGATKLTCKTITLDNSIQVGTTNTSLQVFPTFSGDCTGPLGIATVVDTNGCAYQFTLEDGKTTGPAPHISCPPGKEITFTIGELCTIHTPAQTPDGEVHYANVGSPTGSTREITITPTITEIDATRTGSALCGAASSSTGTFEGDVTITGEVPGINNHIGIWVD